MKYYYIFIACKDFFDIYKSNKTEQIALNIQNNCAKIWNYQFFSVILQ